MVIFIRISRERANNRLSQMSLSELPSPNQSSFSHRSQFSYEGSSIYIDYDGDLNNQYDYIGLLICIKNREQSISTSTAFLINQTTLITARHSFQNKYKEFVTNKIVFIPGCQNQLKEFRYETEIKEEDVLSTCNQEEFQEMEIGRELAVVSLREPIKVGIRTPKYLSFQRMSSPNITIVGYPETKIEYSFITEKIRLLHIERRALQGSSISKNPDKHTIEHRLSTLSGMSGSPIIGHYSQNGKEMTAFIGIHARGANFEKYNNLGLLFTPKIIDKINEYIHKNQNQIDDAEQIIYNTSSFQLDLDISYSSSSSYEDFYAECMMPQQMESCKQLMYC